MAQYLRNKSTGVVFERDNDIARYPHMVPCNEDGSDITDTETVDATPEIPQFTAAEPAEAEAVEGDPVEEAPAVKPAAHKKAAK